MSKYIPLSIPNFNGNEEKYVNDAVSQGWVSTGGAYVRAFEAELSRYLHVADVAVCQSGTAALHLALIEAGVTSEDIVLVPPVTFIAAVNPVRYQGATPVFIDCDDSLCMDPVKLKSFCKTQCDFSNDKLTYNGKRVKAIVVVHVFGNMADMESIMEIAKSYNLIVIEDATEALGTRYESGAYNGQYAGTIGDFGAFSFNGNKIITTGGGGAVTSKDASVVGHLRYLSTQAKDDPHYYIHNEIGYNYRMTNLQAALGVAQMEELPDFIKQKNKNYEIYKESFKGFDAVMLLPFRPGVLSNKWFYSLVIDREKVNATLKDIITRLETEGIQTRAVWGLINEQKPYKWCSTYKLEKAYYYADRIINIPSSTQITQDEILFVVDKVKMIIGDLSNG